MDFAVERVPLNGDLAESLDRADEIVWNARFRSMFVAAPEHGRVSVDISRVDEIETLT